MIQKRGISPLIATVLLIGFTVVLAGIIFTWGQGWIGGLTTSTGESTTLHQICIERGELTISGVCDVSESTEQTRVTVINTGSEGFVKCSIVGGGDVCRLWY